MANLTVYLLESANLRSVDRHLSCPEKTANRVRSADKWKSVSPKVQVRMEMESETADHHVIKVGRCRLTPELPQADRACVCRLKQKCDEGC